MNKDKTFCIDCLKIYHSIPPYDRTFNPDAQNWDYQKYIMETFDKDILFECETQLGVSHFDIIDIKGEPIVNEREIKVVTLPVIDYSILDQIALDVKEELAKIDIKSIAPTEDSVSFLKKLRAEKRKQLDEFESSRKAIKKAITEPYDLFNKAYEEKIAKQFKDLDDYLVKAIGEVENGLKDARTTELVAYFSSLITDDLNWLTFDKVGLKVNLSDSPKSQKSEIEKFVTKVQDDINLIFTQNEPQRILVRYKTSLNVSQAITSVTDEIKQEEALKQLKAVREEIVEPVTNQAKPIEIDEPVFTTSFRVKGTKNQLLALKKYINQLGLEIVD